MGDREQLQGSEIIYFQSNSNPVPLKKPGKDQGDPSQELLEAVVYQNALEQSGDPAILGALAGAANLLKPLAKPENMFKFLFFGLIIYSLIRSMLGF